MRAQLYKKLPLKNPNASQIEKEEEAIEMPTTCSKPEESSFKKNETQNKKVEEKCEQ